MIRKPIVYSGMIIILTGGLCTAVEGQTFQSNRAHRFDEFPVQSSVHGSLRNESAVGINAEGRVSKAQNIGELKMVLPLGQQFWISNSLRAIFDPINRLEQRKDFDAAPLDRIETTNRFELDLREIYADIGLGMADLRIGRQQVVWGRADGLRILDVVNPQDWREFLLQDFDQSRIPLWMARGHLYSGDYTFDIIWIPDYEPDRLAQPDTEFESFSPVGPEIVKSSLPIDEPEDWKLDPEYGFRMIRSYGTAELTLNFFNSWENRPTPDGDRQVYQRNKLIGGQFYNTISRTHYRAEFKFVQGQTVPAPSANANGILRGNILTMMFGVDYDAKERWTIADYATLQYIQELILDHVGSMAIDQVRHTFTFGLREDIYNGLFTLDLSTMINMNDLDYLFQPRLTSVIHDRVRAGVGLSLFGGDRNGYFGQFGLRDRMMVMLEYHF